MGIICNILNKFAQGLPRLMLAVQHYAKKGFRSVGGAHVSTCDVDKAEGTTIIIIFFLKPMESYS